jgi:uncharacterized protein (DUF885 family)
MHGTLVMIVAALALALPATEAIGATEAEEMHALFQERFEWRMREFPREAMSRGDYTNADRLTDNSLAAIERRHRETRECLERLLAIDTSRLGRVDQLSRQLFAMQLEWAIRDHRFRTFLAPVGQRSGVHQDIAQMTERVRFETAKDYEDYLSRLGQVPKAVDDAIALMRLGLQEGRTPPRVILDGVPAQFDALLDGGGLDALTEPFGDLPDELTDMQRETLPRKFELEAVPAVRGAVLKLREFVVEEYLPKCRTTIAATDLPDGAAFYEHQLAKMTTTTLGARAIHDLGRKEVARIRAEMMEVIRRSDFLEHFPDHAELPDDELFAKFLDYLRTDPRFYYDDPEELLAGYRDICKRVDAELPAYFRVLPRLPYGVRAIPAFMAPQQTTAYYAHGDIDNAQPGWFYANTYALDQRPRYEMIALAMHEAVPGHHLQSALASELDGLPEFRQDLWVTAYGEGWALYAERLGIEMGLYEDPYDDFGRLLYEMWRACRLVVDPGIHAFGWSRERAIGYMLENTALSPLNIENEVDRYIGWPGQACGYKIGELRIRELRREAEETLGNAFDIRAFHEVVLGAGAVPLPILADRVRRWIRSHPGGASYD